MFLEMVGIAPESRIQFIQSWTSVLEKTGLFWFAFISREFPI